MRRVAGRLGTWGAAVALGALALASGCGRPSDEAWLKFVGFQTSTTSGDTTTSTTITVLDGDLNDGQTDSADAVFSNASITLGTTSGSSGVGITVERARVEYKLNGFSPPADEYDLSLYLPASSVSEGATTASTGTISGFPLVSVALKQWLMDTHSFDDAASTPTVRLTAKVTFFATADDGTDLEVSTSIAVVLTNGGSEAYPGTVSISASNSTTAPAFTVSRTGPTTYALTVYYAVSGTAEAGTDYATLDGYVGIAAQSSSATISVTPLSGYTAGRTVVVSLSGGSGYTVGGADKATVTLQ